MTTGERIRDARKRAGMTQAELADKLSIPFQSVSQWERDIRNPKFETLKKIADALGISVSALLAGDQSNIYNFAFDLGFLIGQHENEPTEVITLFDQIWRAMTAEARELLKALIWDFVETTYNISPERITEPHILFVLKDFLESHPIPEIE